MGKWNSIYKDRNEPGPPAYVLSEFEHLLPTTGKALDLACGLGGNSLFMASHGLHVTAWDISDLAIEKVNLFAARLKGISLLAEVRDIEADPPLAQTFDVILVSHFLNRDLCTFISRSLMPKGILFYQTFTQAGIQRLASGPSNPAYLLAKNELPSLFDDLEVLAYIDESELENSLECPIEGLAGQACLVAQAPGHA